MAAGYEQVEKIVSHFGKLNEIINPHSLNNYLPIELGNNTVIELDVKAKTWFWSDNKLKRFPLDLFYADYVLSLKRHLYAWNDMPTGTSTLRLPNGTEAKHTVSISNGIKTVSIGFTNNKDSRISGGLDKKQFRIFIKAMEELFGDFFNEVDTKLNP